MMPFLVGLTIIAIVAIVVFTGILMWTDEGDH